MAAIRRFAVNVTVLVEATTEEEAALVVERELAGKFNSELVSVVEAESS